MGHHLHLDRSMNDRDSLASPQNFAFKEKPGTERVSLNQTIGNVTVQEQYAPPFESKLDIKEPAVKSEKKTSRGEDKNCTSFFLRALDEEQNEEKRKKETQAQIDALQAELDSPNVTAKMGRHSKLAPLVDQKKKEEEMRIEQEKER